MLISSLCLTSPHQAKKEANTKHKKEIKIMTQTMCAREEHVEEMQSAYKKLEKKYTKLQGDFEAAMAEVEILEMKLESAEDDDNDILEIREGKREKPVGFHFVRHCGTLLATGGSVRSVREQVLLNAGFFFEW